MNIAKALHRMQLRSAIERLIDGGYDVLDIASEAQNIHTERERKKWEAYRAERDALYEQFRKEAERA